MRSLLRQLFYRPAIRSGIARDSRGGLRNPRFVSFLAQNNRKTLDTDFQDALLRGRQWIRRGLVMLLAAGGAWVLLESAKALSVF